MRLGPFSRAHSRVQMPVGPAPIMSTVSDGRSSDMRTAQKPVASTSPTNRACSSVTDGGMGVSPQSA